jgi:hypothetical protein
MGNRTSVFPIGDKANCVGSASKGDQSQTEYLREALNLIFDGFASLVRLGFYFLFCILLRFGRADRGVRSTQAEHFDYDREFFIVQLEHVCQFERFFD